MVEVWLPVLGFEGLYEVSNLGNCRNCRTGNVLVPADNGHGYLVVSLSRDGIVQTRRLHRLVLIAFCGSEPFDGAIAAHNDGDRSNAKLTNLRWASAIENQEDRNRHGTMCRGSDVFGAVLTDDDVRSIRVLTKSGLRNREIAEIYGVSISTIHLIRHGKTWRHVQ